MISLLLSIFLFQIEPPGAPGFPYWIFWLLVCIILLLITFIFLRDKDLRQRLNSFFSRAKRKFDKIRLQARLKKEKQKKEDLLKALGATTWKEGIKVKESEKTDKELNILENNKDRLLKEIKEADAKIKMLNKQLEENSQKLDDRVKEKETELNPYKEKMTKAKEKDKSLELDLTLKKKEIENASKNLKAAEKEVREIE
ncbi:unnamed protein product, partial [marine sediment metagenome]